MTAKQTALYLAIPIYTIYHMAERGKLPGRKVGGVWEFKKSEIDSWKKKAPVSPRRNEQRPR